MKIYRLSQQTQQIQQEPLEQQDYNKEKILIIMRGISGSGKSTLAKELGQNGIIFSTDDFFMKNGKYMFDPKKIGEAHQWNLNRAIQAMQQEISPIVIDNTNTQAWEAKKYVEEGKKRGYKIEVREPNTPWKFDAEELAKRNTHGVPKASIEKMLNRWEPDLTEEKILQSKSPF